MASPTPVILELPANPEQTIPVAAGTQVAVVDMDDFSASNKCACAASDDNPF